MKNNITHGRVKEQCNSGQLRWALLATTAITLCMGTPQKAGAQEARAAENTLEEVVVTARKREESLQKTPISVSVISADMLQKRQLNNVNEIAKYVPNLQYSSTASGTSGASGFFIRGIGQVDFISTTEPGVGTYLDGVYLARVTGAAIELADVERVEVLRGPQGTLFGRNTIGGAVNIITGRPTGEFSASAGATVGSHNRLTGRFTVDFPIVEGTLAGKASFLGKRYDGWATDSEPTGDSGRMGVDADTAGRLQLLWTPSSNSSFLLATDYTRRRGTVMPHGRVFYEQTPANAAFDDGGRNSVVTGPEGIELDTPIQDDLDVFGISLTSDFAFDGFDLKLITAYREQQGLSGQDYDGGAQPILNQFIDSDQWQFSQEAQISGTSMDDKLDWLVGAYYFTEKGQFDSDIVLTGIPVLIYTGNKTESFAAFGQATYQVSDKLSLTAGIRWTTEDKNIDVQTLFGPFLLVDANEKADFSSVSPKGGIEYQATDDVLLYASIARGFRSGGYNGRPFSPGDLKPFDEEKTTSYEAGIKSDLYDNRVRLNLAAFYTVYDDIQLTAVTTDDLGNFIVITDNAGKAKMWGFEAEFRALPTEGLELFGSLGYTTNGKLRPKPDFDFGGQHLPMAAEWTLNIGAEYSFPAGDFGEITLGGDYSYRSSFYPQFTNSELAKEDGYSLVNARISLEPDNAQWRLSIWGKNLTDEVYRTFGQDATNPNGVVVAWFGPTREWGATLDFYF